MAVEYQVHYYEPNNLEHNPEDLNVGVYFEVDVQKRGSFDSGTYKGEASFGFKPVNVFGGEDNLITTSYSDITMLELSNGGNTESIGIESINIKYNSWYFPEVNIKFVDVIVEILDDNTCPKSIKLNASKTVLDYTLKMREQNEIIDRLKKLEERMEMKINE